MSLLVSSSQRKWGKISSSIFICLPIIRDMVTGNKNEPIIYEVCNPLNYRLCILVSGSLITVIFNLLTLISFSCLHLGQYKGKFISSVSFLILTLVLLPHIGHKIHSSTIIFISSLLTMFKTTGSSYNSNNHDIYTNAKCNNSYFSAIRCNCIILNSRNSSEMNI